MSRPPSHPSSDQFDDPELISTNESQKYVDHKGFMAEKPHEVDEDVVRMAFEIIDTDRDELISNADMNAAIKKRGDIKISKELCEAMFLDAAATKFTQPGTESRSYGDKIEAGVATINLSDVVASLSFRKNPRDKKWVPRRMREQWLLLIAGLLPKNHRDRLFAPSPSPIFTPPALTSRERDTLNVSPIGFVSSRPSSRPTSPNDTLSGYFSGLTTKASNPIQKPRFVNTAPATLPKGSLATSSKLSGSGKGGMRKSSSVNAILMRKRPRSRADGRLSSLSKSDARNNQSVELAMGIVRATTPHSTMSSPVLSSPIRPMTSSATLSSTSSFADFMGLSYQPPHETSDFGEGVGSLGGTMLQPPCSPVFAFNSKSSHNSLGNMIKNTSLLQDQQLRGVKAWETKRALVSREKVKPNFNTVCGKATVSEKWRRQQSTNARVTLEDNKGWSNKMDAFEKRLEAGERETRDWIKAHGLKNLKAVSHTNDIQQDKVLALRSMRNFWGRSSQGTFNIDEEKPYVHEFRDWKRLPVFYN